MKEVEMCGENSSQPTMSEPFARPTSALNHENEVHILAAVIAAEERLAAASLTLDLDVFEQLLHPDYVIIQPGGLIENKAETIASLASDTRHWQVARSDEMDVRLYGDTAVVIGRWTSQGQNGDEPFDYQARFLSVWVKEGEQWRNVAFQSTPMQVEE
jgi:ketosteroid isomerase-like protein